MVKDQTGEVITDQEGVRSRWLEHFKQPYNPHRDTDDTVFSELPVADTEEDDYPELLRSEIEAAIAKLKKRKSPGVDNISAEEIQAAGSVGVDILFELCRQIWNTESFP